MSKHFHISCTAAAEALKSETVAARPVGSLETVLNPSQVMGVRGCYPRTFFENIGTNLCNLVHFGGIRSSKVGRKIDAFCVPLLKVRRNLPPLPYSSAAPDLVVHSLAGVFEDGLVTSQTGGYLVQYRARLATETP